MDEMMQRQDKDLPEWAVEGILCPGCGDEMEWNWVWAGEFDLVDDDNDDHPVWFLVCEDCQTNYDLIDNKPVECK